MAFQYTDLDSTRNPLYYTVLVCHGATGFLASVNQEKKRHAISQALNSGIDWLNSGMSAVVPNQTGLDAIG